jgi:hypothetical protein
MLIRGRREIYGLHSAVVNYKKSTGQNYLDSMNDKLGKVDEGKEGPSLVDKIWDQIMEV